MSEEQPLSVMYQEEFRYENSKDLRNRLKEKQTEEHKSNRHETRR